MKIIVSKTMVKALNAAAKKLNKPVYFTYCECGYTEYRQCDTVETFTNRIVTNYEI